MPGTAPGYGGSPYPAPGGYPSASIYVILFHLKKYQNWNHLII
jgi:hypothetical protein